MKYRKYTLLIVCIMLTTVVTLFTLTNMSYAETNIESMPVSYGDKLQVKSLFLRNILTNNNDSVTLKLNGSENDWIVMLNPDDLASSEPIKYGSRVLMKSVGSENYIAINSEEKVSTSHNIKDAIWVIRNPQKLKDVTTIKQFNKVAFESIKPGVFLVGLNSKNQAQVSLSNQMSDYSLWTVEKVGVEVIKSSTDEVNFFDVIKIKSAISKAYLVGEQQIELKLPSKHTFIIPQGDWMLIDAESQSMSGPIEYNNQIYLYSPKSGAFLSVDASNKICLSYTPDDSSKWNVYHAYQENYVGAVKKNDIIALKSVKSNHYLKSSSGNSLNVGLSQVEGVNTRWYLTSETYLKNWMSMTDEINNKQLNEITFPATHDSGTWTFMNEMAEISDNKDLREYVGLIKSAVKGLTNIKLPYIDYTVKLENTVIEGIVDEGLKTFYSSTKAFSICTYQDMEDQLNSGIRWFDIRVYLRDGGAYTHHFLTGVKIHDMLDDLKVFLDSTNGEIIVLELTHFEPSLPDDSTASEKADLVARFDAFLNQVESTIGGYIYTKEYDSTGQIINNPLEIKYKEIVGEEKKSKVILLINGETVNQSENEQYWQYDQLGIDAKAYGYANKVVDTEMIEDQKVKFNTAVSKNEVFTLWYTLTSQPDDCIAVVKDSVYESLIEYAVDKQIDRYIYGLIPSGVIDDLIDAAKEVLSLIGLEPSDDEILDEVKDYIKSYISKTLYKLVGEDADYRSTYELGQRINSMMHESLHENFQSVLSGINAINVIYGDFTNESNLVETAIQYSRLSSKKK